jgi:hydrogenase maturation protease
MSETSRLPVPDLGDSRLLVLGLGNALLGDDGIGPAAVSLLRSQYVMPDGVRLLDGGTLGLSLLPYLEQADAAILIDAINGDGPAGTFIHLEGEDVGPAVAMRLSPHQVGVADLLDGARWLERYPKHVVLLGLVPGSIELNVGLSPKVAEALPQLLTKIVAAVGELGFALQPHRDESQPHEAIDIGLLAAWRGNHDA